MSAICFAIHVRVLRYNSSREAHLIPSPLLFLGLHKIYTIFYYYVLHFKQILHFFWGNSIKIWLCNLRMKVKRSQAQPWNHAKSFQTPTSSRCQHINVYILSSHHHHPLPSWPLPHPSHHSTTISTTYPSLPSPSPLLRDVGWYLKCYLSPPGAPNQHGTIKLSKM